MNLFAQLVAATAPRAEQPSRQKAAPRAVDKNCNAANEAKHARTVAKYREVMGDDWVDTRTIEKRLGYSAGSVFSTLDAWAAMRIVERRPRQNKPYNRRAGWEWRFR